MIPATIPAQPSILVVDDEPFLCDILVSALNLRGYQASSVGGGEAAQEWLGKHSAQVVIADVRMPKGGGLELLGRLKTVDSASPVVILISGYAEVAPEEAYDLGAEALINKPFSNHGVGELVSRLLVAPGKRWAKPKATCLSRIEVRIPKQQGGRPKFRLGRGGFFLAREKRDFEFEDLVEFNVEIEGGEVPRLEGHGIVRWIREVEDRNGLPGCGIDILSLTSETLFPVLHWIDRHHPRAFIPKGT